MRLTRIICLLAALTLTAPLWAQTSGEEVVIDYNNPKKYIVGGVDVEGNNYFAPQQIIQITGLQKGMEVTVPSEDLSAIVKRLWLQRYFEDVAVVVDSLAPSRDTAFFKIRIVERPRVSRWTFSGVKSGEQKELQERLNLRRGGEYSDYVAKTSIGIIERYYKEKGFYNVKVDVNTKQDTVVRSAIRVQFAVDRGTKVKVKSVNKWAVHSTSERLLEAHQRGMWNTDPETLNRLRNIYMRSEGTIEEAGL